MSIHKGINGEAIKSAYISGKCMNQIAEETNISQSSVWYWLNKLNVKIRPSGSTWCKDKKGLKKTKGFTMRGKYKIIYTPFHPDATKLGYVAEHRLVMEKHIGRRLLKSEVVHHINENPLDNRIENLQILTKKTHASTHSEVSDFINKYSKKKCRKCHAVLPVEWFKKKNKKPFFSSDCKFCCNERRRLCWKLFKK